MSNGYHLRTVASAGLGGLIIQNIFEGSDYGGIYSPGQMDDVESNVFINQKQAFNIPRRDFAVDILNNYVQGTNGIQWTGANAAAESKISNNIFVCDVPTFGCNYTEIVCSNNLSWGHTATDLWTGASDFNNLSTVDPLIIDADTGEIDETSPAFDAGAYWIPAHTLTDVNDNARVRNGAIDIGAWEVQTGLVG